MGKARLVAIAAVVVLASACSFSNRENPYRGLPDPPSAEQVLEDLNVASLGLRVIDCHLFDAPVSRCYEPDRWLGIREGREILGQIHRELLVAGARYWGSSDSPTTTGKSFEVAGLNLGCYFDYETDDYALRVAVVGPSGEQEPCVNGLPGDGVRQVWIIGEPFSPEAVYGRVVIPQSLETLLQFLPPRVVRPANIYGGPDATMDGYYGPELPRTIEDYGVHILADTVSVRDGVVRGLVQYGGAQPIVVPSTTEVPGAAPAAMTPVVSESPAPSASPTPTTVVVAESPEPSASPTPTIVARRQTTGAYGIVIEVGTERYEVPSVVRPGESAPFEITLPAGFDATDLRVAPGWDDTEVDWRGGQRLDGPTSTPGCGIGTGYYGADIPELVPGAGQECLELNAQASTSNTWIRVDAIVATFAPDGTVTEVSTPYVLRADYGEPGLGSVVTYSPILRIAWLAPTGSEESTGVWVHYAKRDEVEASEGR